MGSQLLPVGEQPFSLFFICLPPFPSLKHCLIFHADKLALSVDVKGSTRSRKKGEI